MRWDELFADLEGQARAWSAQDTAAEIADRSRGELVQVRLANRLRSHLGRRLTLSVAGVGEVSGLPRRVGPDYLLLDGAAQPGDGETLVALDAVLGILDLRAEAVSPEAVSQVDARLGLASVLRAVAADRAGVTVVLREGTRCHGTVARVGADWCDLAEHHVGEAPRQRSVLRRRTLPFAAIATMHRHASW